MRKLILWALIFLWSITSVLLSYSLLILFLPFYLFQASRLSTNPILGAEVSRQVVKFLGSGEKLDAQLFNARELMHMDDVANIVQNVEILFSFIFFVLILLLIFYFQNYPKKLHRDIIFGLKSSLIILISIISIFYLLSFSSVFQQFHLLLFDPGTFIFLNTDTLIKAFPQIFFYQFSLVIGLVAFFLNLILFFLVKKQKVYKQIIQ